MTPTARATVIADMLLEIGDTHICSCSDEGGAGADYCRYIEIFDWAVKQMTRCTQQEAEAQINEYMNRRRNG